jgi:hypothetical protein
MLAKGTNLPPGEGTFVRPGSHVPITVLATKAVKGEINLKDSDEQLRKVNQEMEKHPAWGDVVDPVGEDVAKKESEQKKLLALQQNKELKNIVEQDLKSNGSSIQERGDREFAQGTRLAESASQVGLIGRKWNGIKDIVWNLVYMGICMLEQFVSTLHLRTGGDTLDKQLERLEEKLGNPNM